MTFIYNKLFITPKISSDDPGIVQPKMCPTSRRSKPILLSSFMNRSDLVQFSSVSENINDILKNATNFHNMEKRLWKSIATSMTAL